MENYFAERHRGIKRAASGHAICMKHREDEGGVGVRACMRADRSFLETGHNPLDVAPTPPAKRMLHVLYARIRLIGSRTRLESNPPRVQPSPSRETRIEKFYSAGLSAGG